MGNMTTAAVKKDPYARPKLDAQEATEYLCRAIAPDRALEWAGGAVDRTEAPVTALAKKLGAGAIGFVLGDLVEAPFYLVAAIGYGGKAAIGAVGVSLRKK